MVIAPAACGMISLYLTMRFLPAVFSTPNSRILEKQVKGLEILASQQFALEPSACVIPMSVSSCGGDVKCSASLSYRQAGEVTEFYHLCCHWVFNGQSRQSFIDRKELLGSNLRG